MDYKTQLTTILGKAPEVVFCPNYYQDCLLYTSKAITDGGAWCVMTGFNRWGATWCGANSNLLNGFLREELGMRGMCTVSYTHLSSYSNPILYEKGFGYVFCLSEVLRREYAEQ